MGGGEKGIVPKRPLNNPKKKVTSGEPRHKIYGVIVRKSRKKKKKRAQAKIGKKDYPC